jgi:hypothetical protein
MIDPLLTEQDVADQLNWSVRTLQKKRWQSGGPVFIKLAPGRFGSVRYRQSDVDAYIAAGVRTSTSDPGGGSDGQPAG